jgi:selenide,water dikinase
VSAEPGPLDDAALLCPAPGEARGLVFTLDVITPIVDDPRAFGAIAAANAISDIYAMGGEPQVALSFIGIPDAVPLDVLEAILAGATDKAHEAGCAIVGGHSIRDAEPKVGLAVIGNVDPARTWTHRRGAAGQKLVLTKPIGTGVIAQAAKADQAQASWVAEATRWMSELNRAARDAGMRHGATAATDVTGFGLVGHLHHLAAASGIAARIDARAVPLLDGALDCARAGHVPGGSKRNLRYVGAHLSGHDALPAELVTLLGDAQTSGGLLLALPESEAAAVVAELGAPCAVIGELVPGPAGQILVG